VHPMVATELNSLALPVAEAHDRAPLSEDGDR
jgi:hypothetical protein